MVRGGRSGRPVYDQLVHAVEEFFPESGILDGEVPPARPSNVDSTNGHPPANGGRLHRTQTGMSSIVGPNNGERPGGFVLVIDGTALDTVCGYEFVSFFLPKTLLVRYLPMKIVKTSFSDSPCCARVSSVAVYRRCRRL